MHGFLRYLKNAVYFFSYISLLLVLTGCSDKPKPTDEKKSVLTLALPKADGVSAKPGALTYSWLPSGRKACFAVNVTAHDIINSSTTCLPPRGDAAGFVEGGESLNLAVAKGQNRTLEVWVLLLPEGSSAPCPGLGSSEVKADQVFRIGSRTGLSFQKDLETVNVSVSFPGLNQHLGWGLNLPSGCLGNSTAPLVYQLKSPRVQAGDGIASGGGMTMKAKFNSGIAGGQSEATGAYKMIVK